MDAREEIGQVRRRVGAIEAELEQLKARVSELEARLVSPPSRGDGPVPEAVEPLASGAMPPVIEAGVPPVLGPAAPVFQAAPMATATSAESVGWPPAAPVSPPEPAAPRSSPLREWLEPLQLWPPSGEDNAEVRLAAWWATRIGALLAVIGVVFLGVYVSRHAPPWVRLGEVMAATALVLGLGSWLERKLPKFGAVVFGAGLALSYFCAFAAYGVPAMKVITSPAAAMWCEVFVVGSILGVAWWRNSSVAATMAVMLGHVTAFIALREGPEGFGPWVVLLLGVAAVMLRWARGWGAPSLVALPLTWGFLLAAALAGAAERAMPLGAAWVWAFFYFTLFMLRDWSVAWRGGTLSTLDRVTQVTNSTLAVAVGLLATARSGGTPLAEFYFGSGGLLLAAAWVWRRSGAEALVPVFVCKAFGLVALGVIAEFDGHARGLILLAQAFVMLVSARHSQVRGLRTAAMIAGVVSLAFFVHELRPAGAPIVAGATFAEIAFLAGAIGFVAALARWLALSASATVLASAGVGAAAVGTVALWNTQGWAPAVAVALALVLLLAAGSLRGWTPAAVSAAMLVAAAHAEMWWFRPNEWGMTKLWWNEAVLLVAGGGGLAVLSRAKAHDAHRRILGGVVMAGAAATFVVVCFKGLSPAAALAAASGVAALLTLSAIRTARWPFAAFSAPLLAFGWVLQVRHDGLGYSAWLWVAMLAAWLAPVGLTVFPRALEGIRDEAWRAWTPAVQTAIATGLTWRAVGENLGGEARVIGAVVAALAVLALAWKPGLRPALEASWVLWLAALSYTFRAGENLTGWIIVGAAWAPAVLLANAPRLAGLKLPPPRWRESAEGIQSTIAALMGVSIASAYHGQNKLIAFAAVVALAFAVWRWAGVASARRAVLALLAVTWLAAVSFAMRRGAEGWGSELATVLGVATLTMLLPFALERGFEAAERRRLRWALSAAGLGLAMFALVVQHGEVAHHATVACGIAAMTTFLAGLIGRSRPHRLCGLAGLALCVPRAFVVDLDSTLHRIAAFVALGVVLLWVGFSYHRFRHLIVDDEKKL